MCIYWATEILGTTQRVLVFGSFGQELSDREMNWFSLDHFSFDSSCPGNVSLHACSLSLINMKLSYTVHVALGQSSLSLYKKL